VFADIADFASRRLADDVNNHAGAQTVPSVNGPAGPVQMAATYHIDGNSFSTMEGFFEEISKVMIPGAYWGHNLDAFSDILRGGFGTPRDGFVIRWTNHAVSQERLGYPETVRQLELRLQRCHPTSRTQVAGDLANARAGLGPTAYDWLVEIIRDHGNGGRRQEDGVSLVLE
jgi:RNAse (barnase) inhibitor barstar